MASKASNAIIFMIINWYRLNIIYETTFLIIATKTYSNHCYWQLTKMFHFSSLWNKREIVLMFSCWMILWMLRLRLDKSWLNWSSLTSQVCNSFWSLYKKQKTSLNRAWQRSECFLTITNKNVESLNMLLQLSFACS